MNEIDWFYLTIWIALTIMSYIFKKPPIMAINSVFGFYLAFYFYDLNDILGIMFFALNLYTFYEALDHWEE